MVASAMRRERRRTNQIGLLRLAAHSVLITADMMSEDPTLGDSTASEEEGEEDAARA